MSNPVSVGDDLVERLAKAEAALTKIDAIRNSIIGFQNVGWSDHIYPLVAALEEAGYSGAGYDKMRTEIRTMLAAEARVTVLEAALNEAKKRMRNCRGAIESNQVVDKDVAGGLSRGMAAIDAALNPKAPS